MAYNSELQDKFRADYINELNVDHMYFYGDQSKQFKYISFEYPVDELGTERYPHFMVFYINANTKSALGKNADSFQEGIKLNNTSGMALSKTGAGEFAATPFKRLKMAICLPMPSKVRADYSIGYQETEAMGKMGAVITSAMSGQGFKEAGAGMINTMSQVMGPSIIKGLGAAIGAKTGIPVGDVIDIKVLDQINAKVQGAIVNRRQEQLFESVKFRSHDYTWLFLPRSKEESDAINAIITTFKFHSHPEIDGSTTNSMMILPDEFDIEFRYGNNLNKSISRVATSVLARVNVDYTPVGEFISFDGYSDPIAVSLSLTFMELEPLYRDMIQRGF